MVLLHRVALEGLPAPAITVRVEAAAQSIDERVAGKLAESDPRRSFGRFICILDGILEPAGRANHRERAVAHRIHLVQPAWFVPRRHEEHV